MTDIIKDNRGAAGKTTRRDTPPRQSVELVYSEDDVKACAIDARALCLEAGGTAMKAAGVTKEQVAGHRMIRRHVAEAGIVLDTIQGKGLSRAQLVAMLVKGTDKVLKNIQNHEQMNGRWTVYEINISLDSKVEMVQDDTPGQMASRNALSMLGISIGAAGAIVMPGVTSGPDGVSVQPLGDDGRAAHGTARRTALYFEVVAVDLLNMSNLVREMGAVKPPSDTDTALAKFLTTMSASQGAAPAAGTITLTPEELQALIAKTVKEQVEALTAPASTAATGKKAGS